MPELNWFNRHPLPEDTVPYVEHAIANPPDEVIHEFGWPWALGPGEGIPG